MNMPDAVTLPWQWNDVIRRLQGKVSNSDLTY